MKLRGGNREDLAVIGAYEDGPARAGGLEGLALALDRHRADPGLQAETIASPHSGERRRRDGWDQGSRLEIPDGARRPRIRIIPEAPLRRFTSRGLDLRARDRRA